MEIGERIKMLRLTHGITQAKLGEDIGVSDVSIRCWENGTKNPSMNAIITLADLFAVSTDYLLGVSQDHRASALLTERESIFISNYRTLDQHGKQIVDVVCSMEKERVESESLNRHSKVTHSAHAQPTRYIPKYTTPSAAGLSAPLDGDDFEMMLVDSLTPSEADFAVRIQGDSMNPYIHDGDTVYVKKDCELANGDVGIFCVDGSMYCKQYYVDDYGNLTLVSSNPDLKHTNVYVSSDSGLSVTCYGKVLLGFNVDLPDYLER